MSSQQKYRITERLDAGGMAEVFRGVAESIQGFKKSVAIKRILPNLTKNRKFVSMFLDEARVSLHLQHANVVQVFDLGVADGAYFIVMEYVEGANLKTIIESTHRQGRRIRVAQAVYIAMEVCKGLAYAHDLVDPENNRPLHIVHRDVSPPNILVSKMGEVKLVDFGLAKAASQVEVTDPGVVKGKFAYLAPEAAMGQEVDHRADIFAMGIILYEMLTSKRLFLGDSDYATIELVRQAKVPSIIAQNPEVDSELEAIVRKALSHRVDDRFQTASDLQDALAQHLFSHNLKVTSSDIRKLVLDAVRERAKTYPPTTGRNENLIDTLIREEVLQLRSIDSPIPSKGGNRPLSPDRIAGRQEPSSSGPQAAPGRSGLMPSAGGPGSGSGSMPAMPPRREPSQEAFAALRTPVAPIQSLEQLLGETAAPAKPKKTLPALLAIVALGIIALAAGAAFVFKQGSLFR